MRVQIPQHRWFYDDEVGSPMGQFDTRRDVREAVVTNNEACCSNVGWCLPHSTKRSRKGRLVNVDVVQRWLAPKNGARVIRMWEGSCNVGFPA